MRKDRRIYRSLDQEVSTNAFAKLLLVRLFHHNESPLLVWRHKEITTDVGMGRADAIRGR